MFALILGSSACAQSNITSRGLALNTPSYDFAVGLRAGETSGLTLKKFKSEQTAIKGIIGLWSHGLSVTGLMEHHAPAFNVAGLNWYYGAGGHVAFDTGYRVYQWRGDRYRVHRSGNVAFGIDGIAGIEYKVAAIPFAFSLDLKPFAEINSDGAIWTSLDPGLGIKLTF